MFGKVRYNDDAERTSIKVDAERQVGIKATFDIDGDEASLSMVESNEAEGTVYGDNLSFVLDYVAQFPFVEQVTIKEYEENDE